MSVSASLFRLRGSCPKTIMGGLLFKSTRGWLLERARTKRRGSVSKLSSAFGKAEVFLMSELEPVYSRSRPPSSSRIARVRNRR